jgi:hypothetical protein
VKHELDKLADELALVRSDQRVDDEFSSLALIDAMRMSTFWGCQGIVESTNPKAGANDMPSSVYNNPDARSIRQSSRNAGVSDLSTRVAELLDSVPSDRPAAPGSTGKRLGPLLASSATILGPKVAADQSGLGKRPSLDSFSQHSGKRCAMNGLRAPSMPRTRLSSIL